MNTRREFHEDEFHEDDDDERDRRTIPDGGRVRVPLMFADEKPPITWARGRPIRDSAPPEFDWTAFHRPGYRTPQMLADAANALVLDAAGDPVEAARAERKLRMNDAWRSPPGLRDWQININYGATQTGVNEAGGGQQSTGDPDALDREKARANRTAGGAVYPDGGIDDAAMARDARIRRMGDAWKSPPGLSTETSVTDTMRQRQAPVADRRGTPILDATAARDAAYAERCARFESAWQTP